MSETSSDDNSVPETRSGSKKSKKNANSPGKVQRSPLFMCIDVSDKEQKYRQKYFKDDQKVVSSNKINCTACGASMKHFIHDGREVFNHPVLKVLMCKPCVKFYGDGSFSPDEDGSDRFCRWCAQGGTLYCCAECTCAFCKKCIKNNLKRSVLDDIQDEDWKCFVCNVKPLWELRAICAAAQSCANQIRRNKRKEIGENLKELQRKLPERTQNRRSSRGQVASSKADATDAEKKRKRHRSTSSENEPGSADHKDKRQKGRRKNEDAVEMDSSDSETELSKLKSNQIKKQLKEKKRCVRESDSDDTSVAPKLRKKDTTSQLQKQNKEKVKDKCSIKVDQSSTKGNVSDRTKPKRLLKNASSADEGNSGLPKISDKNTAQWFCRWLKDLGQDIIDQSNLCSNNVTQVLEKKLSVAKMIHTQNAEKAVSLLLAMIELTSDNLERAKGLLTLNHKYWKSRVVKLNNKLQDDDDDEEDGDDKGNLVSEDDKRLRNRRKPVHEERKLRLRKQTTNAVSESSSECEDSIVIRKKSKKKNINGVSKDADKIVKCKQSVSDSDETHLSGGDNKINRKQKATKKEQDVSKSQEKDAESSSSEDHLCNGIKEVPQNDAAASSNDESTMNEGLAAKLCNENLEDVSKETKKTLEENERTAENEKAGDDESTEEKQKGLKSGRSSSVSKKGNENLENADETTRTSEKEEKQHETTLTEAEAISSPEGANNISTVTSEVEETRQ